MASADKTGFLSYAFLSVALLPSADPGPVRWATPEGRAIPHIQVPCRHWTDFNRIEGGGRTFIFGGNDMSQSRGMGEHEDMRGTASSPDWLK